MYVRAGCMCMSYCGCMLLCVAMDSKKKTNENEEKYFFKSENIEE